MKTFPSVFAAFTLVSAIGAEMRPMLSVDFAKDANTEFFGKTYPVSGDGIAKLPDGQKVLKFGEKNALKVPVAQELGETGTIIFQFALEPFPPFKGTPRRPMCTIDAANRLQFAIVTGANINPPFVQFSFGEGTHSMHYVQNGLKFKTMYTAAMTFDGTKLRCYLDGVLIHEADQPLQVKKGQWRDLFLGPVKNGWYNSGTWQGGTLAKQLKVYDRALTGEEIAAESSAKIVTLREKYPQIIAIPSVGNTAGFPDENAWINAASVYGMTNVQKPEKSWAGPENTVQFLYDSSNLYLKFRSVIPAGINIKRGHSAAEGKKEVWGYESFELYIVNGKDRYRFAGCVEGGTVESKNNDGNFRTDWTYLTATKMQIDDTTVWIGKITIPWKSIGYQSVPKDGLLLNFCRTWRLNDALILNSLSRPGFGYDDIPGYVKLVPASGIPFVQTLKSNDPSFGMFEGKLNLCGNGKVLCRIIAGNEKGLIVDEPVFRKDITLQGSQTMDFSAILQKTGTDALVFSLTDPTGKTVYQQQILPVRVSPEYFRVAAMFGQEKLQIQFRLKQAESKFGKGLYLELTAPDGKVLCRKQAESDAFEIPFAKTNAAGNYCLVLKAGEKVCASSVISFPGFGEWSIPEKNGRIIPPYTPMKVSGFLFGKTVSVLGREYKIDRDTLFLSGIVSKGEQILSSPVSLRVSGKDVSADGKTKWGKITPQRAEYASAAENSECKVENSAWIEYDGVAFYQVDFKALKDTGNVDLVFQLPREIAKYLHAGVQPWGSKITDLIHDGKREMRYFPVVFLGKEDKGFSFFAESRYTWPEKGVHVMQLDANEKDVTFTVRLASSMKAGEQFHFEFGCMGTPAKTLPKNYPLNIMGGFMELNRPAGMPCSYITFANWRDGQTHGDCLADLPLENNPQMKHYQKEVERFKQHNAKIFPYAMNMCLPDEYPEVSAFAHEWGIMPQSPFPYEKNGKKYGVHFLCAETSAADYYIWHLRSMLKTAKMDGMYFDFGNAPVCNNAQHGCHEKTTILATRDFLRRVALALLESGAKDYAIIMHNTDFVQMPAMTFATHLFNGEHIRQGSSALLHNGKDILDSYPLAMFACELNSMPFGLTNSDYLPADVLNVKYGGGKEDPELYVLRMTRAMLAGTLIHNTIPSMQRSHRGIFDKITRIYEAFGVPDAEFLGYWDKRNPAEVVEGKDVYASSYRSADGKKLLTVVSHVGNQRINQTVKIRFAPEKYGIGKLTSAVEKMEAEDPAYKDLYELRKKYRVPTFRAPLDYVSGGAEIVSWQDGVLTLKLEAHTFAIIELK